MLSCAFSRDQKEKIYVSKVLISITARYTNTFQIQDRMKQTRQELEDAYLAKPGSFFLCGPTWPVPDVTAVLEETINIYELKKGRKKINPRRRIEELKDAGKYVLEVY